jgi:hypothetical protein
MTTELKIALWVSALIALALITGLVSLHEKHYSRRRLELLESDVATLRKIVTEDRTV